MADTSVRVTVASVPEWAIKEAAKRTDELHIPTRMSSIVLTALGYFIGLNGNALSNFAQPRPGRQAGTPRKQITSLDEFLASLDGS